MFDSTLAKQWLRSELPGSARFEITPIRERPWSTLWRVSLDFGNY